MPANCVKTIIHTTPRRRLRKLDHRADTQKRFCQPNLSLVWARHPNGCNLNCFLIYFICEDLGVSKNAQITALGKTPKLRYLKKRPNCVVRKSAQIMAFQKNAQNEMLLHFKQSMFEAYRANEVSIMNQEIRQEKSAMALVLCNGKILATEEDIYGRVVLSLPKGHVEKGEKVAETAIRECFEETGVVLQKRNVLFEVAPFTYQFSDLQGNTIQKTICTVVFRLDTISPTRITEKRIKSAKFLDVEDFLQRCSYQNVKNAVQSALAKLQAEVSA